MNSKNLARMTFGSLLLGIGLVAAAAEEVITQGVDVDVRQYIDTAPQGGGPAIGQDVQDLGDGTTNEGGVPDVSVDPRDAAIEGEKNLGPNAPGYIP